MAQVLRPGANVAAVARAHGLHPNRVYGWREKARRVDRPLAGSRRGFVPVTVSDLDCGGARVEFVSPRGYRVILHGAVDDLALMQVLALVDPR
jgi:hypothetical protein